MYSKKWCRILIQSFPFSNITAKPSPEDKPSYTVTGNSTHFVQSENRPEFTERRQTDNTDLEIRISVDIDLEK